MAGITSTIIALAGLGMSVKQAFDASQEKKDADQAATAGKNRIESIKQQNQYSSLQAPDVSGIAFEQNSRAQADTLEALKGMGAEGASVVTDIEATNREANLVAAEKQGQVNYGRDQLVAEVDQNIEDSRVDRETALAWGELEGAQLASADATKNKRKAIKGIVKGVGNTVEELGQYTSLENKAQRAARKANRGLGIVNDVEEGLV